MATKLFPNFDGKSDTRQDLTLIDQPNGNEWLQVLAEIIEHQRILKNRVYDFSAVVSTNGANVSDIAISALDSAGNLLAGTHVFELWLSDDAGGAGLTATSASGTVTVKTSSGAVIGTLTTKKSLLVQSLASGIFTLEITDTGKTAFVVCAKIPGNGLTKVITTLSSGSYG